MIYESIWIRRKLGGGIAAEVTYVEGGDKEIKLPISKETSDKIIDLIYEGSVAELEGILGRFKK